MIKLVLYFFIYCFIGWIYETVLVSVQKHKWVNRGFMHGPFLPIYGIGALLCIGSNIVSQGYWPLTFFYAVIVCTIMELSTGLAMESIFKVRYWDYRNYPLNIKGYICPAVSALWGVLAIVVSNYIHPILSEWVALIPYGAEETIVYILSIYSAGDFVVSWAEGIDLRDVLEEMAENSKMLDELMDKIDDMQDRAEDIQDLFSEKLSEYKNDLFEVKSRLTEVGATNKDKTLRTLEITRNKMSSYIPNLSENEYSKNFVNKFNEIQAHMKIRNPRRNKRALKVLRRNPHVVSAKYRKELKSFSDNVKKKRMGKK